MDTKAHILELFESNRGQYISGEYIADKIGVTRNAIWKAVKELEKDGYKINALTKRGYRFCESNDILSSQGIGARLLLLTKKAYINVHKSLKSTNETAKELAVSGADHGTIIIADHQTAGRGRYNRSFFSPPGCGIYMSFILRPSQCSLPSSAYTTYTAVSVCEAIEEMTDAMPQIKWVNDIFIDGKKVCGILTEAVTDFESGCIQWIVVGIGINFTTSDTEFPEEIRHIAGSIFLDKRPNITRNTLAAGIINRILNLENDYDSELTLSKYKNRLMMLGKKVTVTGLKEVFEAIVIDIDDEARLIVRKDNGEITSLFTGEVSIKI